MTDARRDIELSLLDLMTILRRRIWLILGAAFLAGVVALILSFVLTPRYRATVSLLPGNKEAVTQLTPMLQRGAIRSGFRLRSLTVSNSVNLEMMASHKLQSALIEREKLVDFFGHAELAAENPELAAARAKEDLQRATHFEISMRMQILFVHVTTRDADASARIANAYLDLLDAMNLERYRHYAEQKAAFLDGEIAAMKEQVRRAETRLSRYQTEHRVTDFDAERSQALELTQGLRTKLLDLELERERLSADVSADSPQLLALEAEREVYARMLAALTEGDTGAELEPALGMPLGQSAGMELDLTRLKRELDLLRELEIFLIQERESARLQAVIDMETFTVLDRAHAPDEPVWPRRRLMVALSATLAAICAGLIAVGHQILRLHGEGSAAAGFTRLLKES